MKNGRCVKCQTPTVYEVDTSRYSRRGIVLSGWVRAGVTYYICTTCGYTEGYVLDQKMRAKIAQTKQHIEPRS
jgi:predicted nucleic-acid-binding Zn-ribbon protein